MSPASIVLLPLDAKRHCSRKVCWCSAGFCPTHVNEKAVGPEPTPTVVDPGSRGLVPPIEVSRTRTWGWLPSNVPLTWTAKFCASVSFTIIPGTFVHVVEVVVAGDVTAAQSRHDARVPGTEERAGDPVGDPHRYEHDDREDDPDPRATLLLHLDPPLLERSDPENPNAVGALTG